jgi:hypothetical protein
MFSCSVSRMEWTTLGDKREQDEEEEEEEEEDDVDGGS